MQLQSFSIFYTIIIFSNLYNLVIGNALLGVNVQNAQETDFPFIACLVQLDNNYTVEQNAFCTGSLLTKFHVLSSEHCMDDIGNNAYRVFIGSTNLRRATSYVPLSWISFDQWSATLGKEIVYPENDITIIKLLISVPNGTPTAQLSPVTDNELLYGKNVVTAGWGVTNNNVLPIHLQKANLKIITNELCEQIISKLNEEFSPVPEELYLCTIINPYVHFGPGDSGGPLMYDNHLIAINKSLCPDIPFHKYQINAHVSIVYYREYITMNTST